MQPLITPNWHVALVHFPIALIAVGTLVELFSFLGWRGSGFRRGGRWMLLLGAVFAVPTTFSGMYALAELLPPGGINELRQTRPALADVMTWHVWTQSVATAVAMSVVVLWVAFSDAWRDRLGVLFKLLLVGVAGLILFGSHLGGLSVYDHGFGVDTARPPATLPTADQAKRLKTWEDLAPPTQTHVTTAGLAVALACVTLGLAVRTASTGDGPLALVGRADGRAVAFNPAALDDPTLPPGVEMPVLVGRNHTPPVRATKFWLLSALLLVVTALLGDWIVAQDAGWNLNAIWDAIKTPIDDNDPALTRRLAHLAAGSVLIVDTLVLALLARFAPRRSVLLLAFAVPLLLALAAQIWLGVLLLFDGPAGAVTGFKH